MVCRSGPRCFLLYLAIFGLVIAACGGDDEAIPDAGGGSPDAGGPRFTLEPTLDMAPNPSTPLAGILRVETSTPSRIEVAMNDGASDWTISFDELATAHELPVLGFRPDRLHTLEVTAISAEGARTTAVTPLEAVTSPLPADFPGLELAVSAPAMIEPGVTLFSAPGNGRGYLIMVDSTGEVVWYYQGTPRPWDARRLDDGNILHITDDRLEAQEIDMLGNVVRHWHAAKSTSIAGSVPVEIDSFHHEIAKLASGNYLTISSELRSLDGYPTSETDPTPRAEPFDVVGDVIVEFEADGTIAGEWSLFDIIDPYRVAYDSFGGFWSSFYGSGIDWTHGNAVIHDPADDTFIVSLRHQDAVIKFDRSGELAWILGPHENWEAPWSAHLLSLTSPGAVWPYHPHAPQLTPSQTMLLFDNGVHRASPPDPAVPDDELYSRAMEVAIDPLAMEVEQLWEYDAGQSIYTAIVGDADLMPETGNVLVTFGAIVRDDPDEPAARLVEVTRESPAVEVWDLHIYDNNPAGATIVYRAERLSSLYPLP
jgi:arylsulfate sulfotransferase